MADNLNLPDIETFTVDEQMLARACVSWARRSGTMFEGRLLEAHVAVVLDAEWPKTAINSWDLRVDGINIQVRSASADKTVSLHIGDDVDVFIVVQKPRSPGDHTPPYRTEPNSPTESG